MGLGANRNPPWGSSQNEIDPQEFRRTQSGGCSLCPLCVQRFNTEVQSGVRRNLHGTRRRGQIVLQNAEPNGKKQAILSFHKIGEPPRGGWNTWFCIPEDTFIRQ